MVPLLEGGVATGAEPVVVPVVVPMRVAVASVDAGGIVAVVGVLAALVGLLVCVLTWLAGSVAVVGVVPPVVSVGRCAIVAVPAIGATFVVGAALVADISVCVAVPVVPVPPTVPVDPGEPTPFVGISVVEELFARPGTIGVPGWVLGLSSPPPVAISLTVVMIVCVAFCTPAAARRPTGVKMTSRMSAAAPAPTSRGRSAHHFGAGAAASRRALSCASASGAGATPSARSLSVSPMSASRRDAPWGDAAASDDEGVCSGRCSIVIRPPPAPIPSSGRHGCIPGE